MSNLSKKKYEDAAIVEALLAGKDESSSETLSVAPKDSVEQWGRVLASVQQDSHDVDAPVIASVMARIEESAIESHVLDSRTPKVGFNWLLKGGLLSAAALALFLTAPFLLNEAGLDVTDASLNVAQSDEQMVMEPVVDEVDSQRSLASLMNAAVFDENREGVILSGTDVDEPIRITQALRLEVVNGVLRIDTL